MNSSRNPGPRKETGAPSPSNLVSKTPRPPGSCPATPEDDRLELPHERDQATDSTARTPDPAIQQAHEDLKKGLVDTDMRATPGLDARERARQVPGPGGQSPGTHAPASPRRKA
jgi:hypothetical protein